MLCCFKDVSGIPHTKPLELHLHTKDLKHSNWCYSHLLPIPINKQTSKPEVAP